LSPTIRFTKILD